MEPMDFLSFNGLKKETVDLTALKTKIISTDRVLKQYKQSEEECKKLKALSKRLESDCTTYERELKQCLEELNPAKKSLEEFRTLSTKQESKIKSLEDQVKAQQITTEQYRELAKSKVAEAEEIKSHDNLDKELKKKEKLLEKSKVNFRKVQEEAKNTRQKLHNLKNSYARAVKFLVNFSNKAETKSLTRKEWKEVSTYKAILSNSNSILSNLKDNEKDEIDNDSLELEKQLQDSNSILSNLKDNEKDEIDNDALELEKQLQDSSDLPQQLDLNNEAKDSSCSEEEWVDVSHEDEKKEKEIGNMIDLKENVVETVAKTTEPEEGTLRLLEHHSYSLSAFGTSPPKTKSLTSPKTVNASPSSRISLPKPEVIIDHGVANSVVIQSDHDMDEKDLNVIEEPKMLQSSFSNVDEMPDSPVDPNRFNSNTESVELQVDSNNFSSTESKPETNLDLNVTTVPQSNVQACDPEPKEVLNPPAIELNSEVLRVPTFETQPVPRVIYEAVEDMIATVCLMDTLSIVPNTINAPHLEDKTNETVKEVATETIIEYTNHCETVTIATRSFDDTNKIENDIDNGSQARSFPCAMEVESILYQDTTIAESVTSSEIVEPTTQVRTIRDEVKKTLRRVRRMTSRISLSAVFEQPLSPLPPSPPSSPPPPVRTHSRENSSDSVFAMTDNEKIVSTDELNQLFGPDSDDGTESGEHLIPPKTFQHQESEGFDSEITLEERVPNSLAKPLKRFSPTAPAREKVTEKPNQFKHIQQCPLNAYESNPTTSNNQVTNESNSNQYSRNSYSSSSSEAMTSSGLTKPNENPPQRVIQNVPTQTRDFNSKLKGNFSHNSATGNYSISICLPDTSNPIKNFNFEIDTVTNEFNLNFGPNCDQTSQPSHSAVTNPAISAYDRKKPSIPKSRFEPSFDDSVESNLDRNQFSSTLREKSSKSLPQTKSSSDHRTHSSSSKNRTDSSRQKPENASSSRKVSPQANTSSNIKKSSSSNKVSKGHSHFHKTIDKKLLITPVNKQVLTALLKKPVLSDHVASKSVRDCGSVIKHVDSSTMNEAESSETMMQPKLPIEHDDLNANSTEIEPVELLIPSDNMPNMMEKDIGKSSDEKTLSQGTEDGITVTPNLSAKRISHCYTVDKECKVSIKRQRLEEAISIQIPLGRPNPTLKRKNAIESNDAFSLGCPPKKFCNEEGLENKLSIVKSFWSSVKTPFIHNSAIETVLVDFYKVDGKDKKSSKNFSKKIYHRLTNPKLVPTSACLIDAIVLLTSKSKKNPYIPTKKDFQFMSPYENAMTAMVFYIQRRKPLFKNIVLELKRRIISFLFSDKRIILYGYSALCRLLTLVCKQSGDSQTPRMVCINLLKEKPESSLFLVANIVSSWPLVLAPNPKMPSNARETFLNLLLRQPNNLSTAMRKFATKVIEKECDINVCPDLNFDTLIKDLLKNFENESASEECLEDFCLCFEILSSYHGWDWTVTVLINTHILSLVEKECLPCVKSHSRLLNLLGILAKNCPLDKSKQINNLLRVFLQIATNEKSEEKVRDNALFNLIHLSHFLDELQKSFLKFWMNNNREKLKKDFFMNKFIVMDAPEQD